MTEGKRKRGRPLGSGKKDDPALMEVARLIARNNTLKPTTAMKRVYADRKPWPETQETLVRRLQEKWRAQGQAMLAGARREMEPKPPVPTRTLAETINQLARPIPWLDPKLHEQIAAIDRYTPMMKRIAEIDRVMESVNRVNRHFSVAAFSIPKPAFFDQMQALARQVEKFKDSPAAYELRRLQDVASPAAQELRRLQEYQRQFASPSASLDRLYPWFTSNARGRTDS